MAGNEITIACVLRSGGVYGSEYVERLKDGVRRHLISRPHRFVCLSDMSVPCERIPLENNWPGWWSKIELFRLDGPVLYFDLDTMIIGDLSDIADQAMQPEFTGIRNWHRPVDGLGSGMMAWNVSMRWLYNRFMADPPGIMDAYRGHGDQGFIGDNLTHWARWQDQVPGQVLSYKIDVVNKEMPKNARVVCFHGYPKPHDIGWTLAA